VVFCCGSNTLPTHCWPANSPHGQGNGCLSSNSRSAKVLSETQHWRLSATAHAVQVIEIQWIDGMALFLL
jgi:hypothetical protein